MISKDDIKKLAALARIKLTEKEEEKFTHEIDAIVGYVDKIQNYKGVSGGEKAVGKVSNILRPDENPHESGENTEALIENAPKREDNYVKVKKIL